MKTHIILLLIAVSLGSIQCKSGRNQTSAAGPDAVEQLGNDFSAKEMVQTSELADLSVVTGPLPGVDPLPEMNSQKIIKDGTLQIVAKDLKKSKTEVDSLVAKFKGYYSNESFNNNDYADEYMLTIRIPSVHFDKFIAMLEAGAGEVVFKNIASRDVTEEFIDLQTRLKSKKEYLGQYGELLKKARSIEDMVEIQEITRKLEEEIESVLGRLKYLNSQVDYSTLNLTISKSNLSKYSRTHGNFIDRLKMSIIKGWYGLVSFLLFVIKIWPFWIIVLLTVYFIKKFRRRKK